MRISVFTHCNHYKTQLILLLRGLEASQGGTKQQDQEEAQDEGPYVLWVDRCTTGGAPQRPTPQGTAAISLFARVGPQEAYTHL